MLRTMLKYTVSLKEVTLQWWARVAGTLRRTEKFHPQVADIHRYFFENKIVFFSHKVTCFLYIKNLDINWKIMSAWEIYKSIFYVLL